MSELTRVCLGPEAPQGLSEFLERAGLEVLPYSQKQYASLYIDFVGARPRGVRFLSISTCARQAHGSDPEADLVSDNYLTVGCFIVSHALNLSPLLLTANPDMLTVVRMAMSVASNPVPLIVTGEIGSGKQAISRLVHSASRRNGTFATLNCASVGNKVLGEVADGRSTLQDSSGPTPILSLAAEGDTLYLDEIAELSLAAQVKLQQLLEASEARPWADGSRSVPDIRYIAATNRPLPRMVEAGDFRRDLFWRIYVLSIDLPPLRKRPEDIPLLARYFLRQANPRRKLSPISLKMLGSYPFPGNVRELQNLIARLAIAPLSLGNHIIDVPDVRRHLVVSPGDASPVVSGWKNSREQARREMVLRVLAANGGNRTAAARKLGITPRALQYHITKAGLSRRRAANPPCDGSQLSDANGWRPPALQ